MASRNNEVATCGRSTGRRCLIWISNKSSQPQIHNDHQWSIIDVRLKTPDDDDKDKHANDGDDDDEYEEYDYDAACHNVSKHE